MRAYNYDEIITMLNREFDLKLNEDFRLSVQFDDLKPPEMTIRLTKPHSSFGKIEKAIRKIYEHAVLISSDEDEKKILVRHIINCRHPELKNPSDSLLERESIEKLKAFLEENIYKWYSQNVIRQDNNFRNAVKFLAVSLSK